ncbi:MAG: hypothetical protein IID32_07775 [Planctomycetes bacterium]|nr:hypothetical protein [Planctomycetota bacterium]
MVDTTNLSGSQLRTIVAAILASSSKEPSKSVPDYEEILEKLKEIERETGAMVT